VKISGRKLSKAMEEAGVDADQLATALAQPGFPADRAASAIRNWMRDNDHPRCKAAYIAKMAQALGRPAKDLAIFTSMVKGHRGSARKAGLLTTLIRGKSVDAAMNLLSFNTKRAAVNIRKCLAAAIADAQLADANGADLVVCESRVDQAMVIKRFQPKDRGRAHQILKPLSHITVSVEERVSSRKK
jgi:large subunit ribosomal protein L22